jgi:acyl dehydratase
VSTSTVELAVVEQFCALVGEPTDDLDHGIPTSFLTLSTADVFGDAVKATVPPAFLERGVIVRRSIEAVTTIPPGVELRHVALPSSLSVGPKSVRIEFHVVSTRDGGVVAEHSILMTLPGVSNPVDLGNPARRDPDAPWVACETSDIPVEDSLASRYAMLTGEDGAVHLSPQTAARLGFDAPILQASCTLALVAAQGRRAMPNGESVVSGITIHFRAPVIPPGVVTVRFSAPQDDNGHTPGSLSCRFDAASRHVIVCEGRIILRRQPGG